jgi:hypothetical protein
MSQNDTLFDKLEPIVNGFLSNALASGQRWTAYNLTTHLRKTFIDLTHHTTKQYIEDRIFSTDCPWNVSRVVESFTIDDGFDYEAYEYTVNGLAHADVDDIDDDGAAIEPGNAKLRNEAMDVIAKITLIAAIRVSIDGNDADTSIMSQAVYLAKVVSQIK